MALSIRVFSTVLLMCLHVILASASPAPFRSLGKHSKWMWTRQARQGLPMKVQAASWPVNHSPVTNRMGTNNPTYHLPPVSDVFKMVAEAEHSQAVKPSATSPARVSPTAVPEAHTRPLTPTPPPAPKADIDLVPTGTTTTAQPSPSTPYRGPGLVIPSSIPGIGAEASFPSEVPSQESSHGKLSGIAGPTPTQAVLDADQPTADPLSSKRLASHKLVIIGAVMAGLMVLMFLVYVAFDRRLFVLCGRKKEDNSDTWKKIDSPPPPGSYYGSEKEIVYQPTPSQRSASSVYSSAKSQASASDSNTQVASNTPVMDIRSNYPRSKFSLCSSEYPASISSETSARTDASVLGPLPGEQTDSASLPAYEFFYPSPESFEDSRHSRTHSAPDVGPVTHGTPELMVRAIQHRRSRSVSGLTYTVKPQEHRESDSSAGGWGGSPQSEWTAICD